MASGTTKWYSYWLHQLQLALANSSTIAYLMMTYSLELVHDMPCIPSLTSSTMLECHILHSAVYF